TAVGIHSWNERLEIDHCTLISPLPANGGFASANGFACALGALSSVPAEHGPNRDLSLHHNEITGVTTAMRIGDSEGVSLSHNLTLGNAFGIVILGVRGGTIAHNTCNDAKSVGLAIVQGLNLVIDDNSTLGNDVGFYMGPTSSPIPPLLTTL